MKNGSSGDEQCLVELSRQALIGGDLDSLLTATNPHVAGVLDIWSCCKVLELQPDGETLLLKAGVGWHEGLVGQATITADVSLQAGYTLQFQAPVIVRDLAPKPASVPRICWRIMTCAAG